jgi:hypothetical protein
LLIVVDSFNYPDLISTMIRLLVAIWMFASCMGGSDPWRGLLSMPIRGLRLVVGFSLIFPQIEVWLVGLLLALVSQLVIRKTGP